MEKLRILAALNIKRMNFQICLLEEMISPTHNVLEEQWNVLHDIKYDRDPADVAKIVGSLGSHVGIPFEKLALAIRGEFMHYEKGINFQSCFLRL
ncbi:MAG: hypothetical protein GY820_23775 [Gammaproteobacteria bacterium]|nr:hypothetical protein [Gammaproteobacteria bacterium]